MQCKKQLTFGKEALSDADCQGKLKRWLLAGLHHPDASRSWHVNLDARQLAGSSREDLDGELQAKLSEGNFNLQHQHSPSPRLGRVTPMENSFFFHVSLPQRGGCDML